MPGNPWDQLPLSLLFEFHDGAARIDGVPQLLQPLVGLPRGCFIGKNHGTIIRDVRKDLPDSGAIRLRQLEKIHLVHLYQGVRSHHGHRFHAVRKGLNIKILSVQLMKIEGLRQVIQKQLFQLLKIMVQQEAFLAMKHIQTGRRTAANIIFQHLQIVCLFFIRFLRHGITS